MGHQDIGRLCWNLDARGPGFEDLATPVEHSLSFFCVREKPAKLLGVRLMAVSILEIESKVTFGEEPKVEPWSAKAKDVVDRKSLPAGFEVLDEGKSKKKSDPNKQIDRRESVSSS